MADTTQTRQPKQPKQLNVMVPEDLHRAVRLAAAELDITIRELVTDALWATIRGRFSSAVRTTTTN